MSINRRTEPFRYALKEPIPFDLLILSINGSPVPPKPVSAVLHDISRSGCRISIPLNIHVENNEVRVGLELVLHEDPLYLEGMLKWNLEQADLFHYGIQLEIPESERERLPREMRTLAGHGKIIVR